MYALYKDQPRILAAVGAETIADLVVASRTFVILTSTRRIIRSHETHGLQQFELKNAESPQLFIEPTGEHVYISSTNGENWYWQLGSPRPCTVAKWQGNVFRRVNGSATFHVFQPRRD